VANVNANDDGKLNANLNHVSNDNVWNSDNRHRIFSPKLNCFSSISSEEFSFLSLFSIRPTFYQFLASVQKV
jgi:hypothetical protein